MRRLSLIVGAAALLTIVAGPALPPRTPRK